MRSVSKLLLILIGLVSFLLHHVMEAKSFEFAISQKVKTAANGDAACQALGFEGMASLSTPEAYAAAWEMITTFWASLPEITSDYSLNIGLYFRENPNRLEWRDGSLPTPDTPWTSSPPKVTASSPYGRLKTDGTIKMSNGVAEKMTLCGNKVGFRYAQGKTVDGHKQGYVDPHLTMANIPSYLECVSLCGQDNWCRAADFNSDLSTCRIFVSQLMFPTNGLVPDTNTSTFQRLNYSL